MAFRYGVEPPLLHQYPVASAAYSLRRIGGRNFSGPAIRVRRSSDNVESDIGFDSRGNLDTGSLLTFCGADSGFVTRWYDQSGNGRNAIQATAGNQPRIVGSGVVETQNSKPAMFFDGLDDRLVSPTVSYSQPLTVINANYLSADGANANFRVGIAFGTNQLAYGYNNTGLVYWFGTSTGLTSTRARPVTTELYFLTYDTGTNSQLAINGVSLATGSINILSGTTLYIGGNGGVGTAWYQQRQQELIVWSSNQSTNRPNIEASINNYYKIY